MGRVVWQTASPTFARLEVLSPGTLGAGERWSWSREKGPWQPWALKSSQLHQARSWLYHHSSAVISWRASLRQKWSSCLGVWAARASGREMKRKKQPGAGGGASANSIAGSTRLWVGAAGRSSRFLMRVLDSYGDDYRTSQLTIVLEDEGSQGTDAPTPGNAENEPPEKEGLSPPRRTPAAPEPSSPAAGEGPSGRKRRRAPREGRRTGVPLTPEPTPMQIKVEEDFGFEADEALDSSWVSRGPDKLLPYPTLASPPFD
ncbi:TCF3 fusion partner isoform X1 [Saccopteryx leptura]|uniref:TCF3 fusion partner isoform X1 n=1 Tax=Saccopteryx leptura TaxID=249018 RepID=UPI00339BF883